MNEKMETIIFIINPVDDLKEIRTDILDNFSVVTGDVIYYNCPMLVVGIMYNIGVKKKMYLC